MSLTPIRNVARLLRRHWDGGHDHLDVASGRDVVDGCRRGRVVHGERAPVVNGLTLALLAAGLVVLAVVWIAVTRDRSTVQWMRPLGDDIAHAVPTVELRAELATVQALGFCGRWPVAELIRDERAERCAVCVRAVEQMEHRHR